MSPEDIENILKPIRVLSAADRAQLADAIKAAADVTHIPTRVPLADRIEAAMANPNTKPALQFAAGLLNRINFNIHASADDRGMVDLFKLNSAMTAANMSTQDRMTVKSSLYKAGLIPA